MAVRDFAASVRSRVRRERGFWAAARVPGERGDGEIPAERGAGLWDHAVAGSTRLLTQLGSPSEFSAAWTDIDHRVGGGGS